MAAGDHGPRYEICVRGRLAPRWARWFDGLRLTPGDDGTTVISGRVADQAALHGLLQRVRDLGVPLVSVTELPSHEPTEPDGLPRKERN